MVLHEWHQCERNEYVQFESIVVLVLIRTFHELKRLDRNAQIINTDGDGKKLFLNLISNIKV